MRTHLTGLRVRRRRRGSRARRSRRRPARGRSTTSWTGCGSGRGPPPRSPPRCVRPPIGTPKPMPAPPGEWASDGRKARRRIAIGGGAARRRQHPDLCVGLPSARLCESGPDAARRAGARLVRQRRRPRPARPRCAIVRRSKRPWRRRRTRWRCQDEQLGALSAAWQGRSADLSRAFLRRHGEASAAAAAAVRKTADALAALRDNLWHTVDGKVAAAIAADDRAPDGMAGRRAHCDDGRRRSCGRQRADRPARSSRSSTTTFAPIG